jgi:uncharacterized protein
MITRLKAIAAAATLVFALGLGAAAPALSQEIPPEQLALARKYVDLTNKSQLYEAIAAMTASQASTLLTQQNPDLGAVIDETIGKVLETRKGKSDVLFDEVARVYAVMYTAEELQQIIAFYETPVGQKLATNAQQVNQDTNKILRVFTQNFGTDFVREVKAKLKEQGYNV